MEYELRYVTGNSRMTVRHLWKFSYQLSTSVGTPSGSLVRTGTLYVQCVVGHQLVYWRKAFNLTKSTPVDILFVVWCWDYIFSAE
jgi:hypothetical protein